MQNFKDFAVTYPVRIAVLNDASDPVGEVYLIDRDGILCVPLFTDMDLLARHFEESSRTANHVKAAPNQKALNSLLRELAKIGVQAVMFDPPGESNCEKQHIYPIEEVIGE